MRFAYTLIALSVALAAQAPLKSATESVTPHVANLIRQGDAFAAQSMGDQAMDAYKKADKADDGHCVSCLLRQASLQRDWARPKQSLKLALQAVTAAGNRAALASEAHALCGELYSVLAGFDHPKQDLLAKSEAEFRAALQAGESGPIQFKLAVILIREGRQADGQAMLEAIAAHPASPPDLVRETRDVLTTPALTREPIVPEFLVTAEDGHTYTKASLRGKVVLFDFWGTWCPPCRESVPMLQRLRKSLAKEKDFVMVGISSDQDESQWRTFIADKHMDWIEALDSQYVVLHRFGIREFPTFLVMDRVGGVRMISSGLDTNFDGHPSMEVQMVLEHAIKAALKSN